MWKFFCSSKNQKYINIEDEDYYSSFGLKMKNGEWVVDNKEKVEKAYERAWANRDYEINKFWTRAAYFWGFIALIFGAYFHVSSKNKNFEYSEFLLICLGIVFSIAWYYVIVGSKRWQENWEKHIDKLEDFVTGPLYKTIYHKGTNYSVSKINEVLSLLIVVVWLLIFAKYLLINDQLHWDCIVLFELEFYIIVTSIITLLFSLSIATGYCKKSYNNEKNKFIRR